MKITTAEFIQSAVTPKQFPDDPYPEIAFAGKSNVGKSTLINTLLNRKQLVKTSATPGKTQAINFFLINTQFYFVDLPGYGYAKVSRTMRKQWKHLLESYLSSRNVLKAVVLIIDIRHGPNEGDLQLKEWLEHYQRPIIVVANKADKLKRGQRVQQLKLIEKTMELASPPLMHSSLEKMGKRELWESLYPWL